MTLQRIGDIDFRRQRVSVAAPNERFLGVDVKTDFRSSGAKEVKCAL